ncbi:MAG: CapA family protein [Clostridia bacterium]|nr:CapA family protein [Clostridia bacterium]
MKKRTRKQKILRRNIFLCITAVLLIIIVALAGCGIDKLIDMGGGKTLDTGSKDDTPSLPEEPYVVSSATVVNTGDILIHSPLLTAAKEGDDYNFSPLFREVSSYFNNADLAIANLEVTLGGREAGNYRGYPAFNTPDSLIDYIKASGVDMLLTSNNHCYDTGLNGLKRTARVLREKNMPFIGTREDTTSKLYTVKEVDGVKIGMACYTYENVSQGEGTKSINGRAVRGEGVDLIASFNYDDLNSFYNEVQSVISDMKQNGAEAIVFYMHWGNEYQIRQNRWQEQIAQKLCDLGVDVIVGGHPHVIQPIDLLTSADGTHKTVCLYSMGNAVSNQRLNQLYEDCPTGHTEDGMLFYYTFDKYSDGKVVLSGVDIIPAWVDKTGYGSNAEYVLYALPDENAFYNQGLSASTGKKSFERTKKIVAEGLTKCQEYLGCEVRFKTDNGLNSAE